MAGYDVGRAIRQAPGGKDILIAAITGWAQDDDRRRAREAGLDRHMVRPVDAEKLRALLEADA